MVDQSEAMREAIELYLEKHATTKAKPKVQEAGPHDHSESSPLAAAGCGNG